MIRRNQLIQKIDGIRLVKIMSGGQMTALEYINQYDELKIYAAKSCKEIFKLFTEEEIENQPLAIKKAWVIGKQISEV